MNGKVLLGVVFLDEEAGGGLELLCVRIFVYDDLTDRGETPLLPFRGDGEGIYWSWGSSL